MMSESLITKETSLPDLDLKKLVENLGRFVRQKLTQNLARTLRLGVIVILSF